MKIALLFSWMANLILAGVLLFTGRGTEKRPVVSMTTPPHKAPAPGVPGSPPTTPSAVRPPATANQKRLTVMTVDNFVSMPRALALHYQKIGTGSMTCAVACLLMPSLRGHVLDTLNLPPEEATAVRAATERASSAMVDIMLRNAPQLSGAEEKPTISLQISAADLQRIRTEFDRAIASLPEDVREAAVALAFDNTKAETDTVAMNVELDLQQNKMSVFSDPASSITVGGAAVTFSTIWKRVVRED